MAVYVEMFVPMLVWLKVCGYELWSGRVSSGLISCDPVCCSAVWHDTAWVSCKHMACVCVCVDVYVDV